jgi:AcrR family transcriptional regulator
MTTAAVVAGSAEKSRPLRRDALRNRQRILEAARELFAERGIEVTLDDIAHRAGLGVGTVYRRFPDRESLVEALFEQSIDEIVEVADRALTMPDAAQGLLRLLTHLAQMQACDRGLRDVMLSTAYGHDRVARARERLVPAIDRVLARAQAEGGVRDDLRPGDIPLLEVMICATAQYSEKVSPELWQRYLALLFDGLCARRDHASELPRPALSEAALDEVMHSWTPPRR